MGRVISKYPVKKLHSVATIDAGFAFKSERFTDDPTDIPLVKGENVQQGYIDWAASRYWPEAEREEHERYALKAGDVVLAMDRPWVNAGLKWAYVKPHDPVALLVQRVSRLRAREDLDQTYLRCLISSGYFSAYIQPIVTGVNVPHISAKQIGGFEAPVPHLAVQRKIAAILSAYDDLIENNRRRIALLEKMAEELYREWFVRLRFPGHEQTRIVKGVPERWSVSSLGEIASFTMGQSPSSEFYNEIGEGLPFNQGVGTYGERFPRRATFCTGPGRRANAGDILFSVRAPVGRLNIADCEMIIGRGLAALRHKQDRNSYLFYLLRAVFANEDIIGNGAIFNSVGKDELSRFPIVLPPTKLQESFDRNASRIDSQITTLIRSNELLARTRDMLLPRLISGKLSVEHLDVQYPPSMQDTADAL